MQQFRKIDRGSTGWAVVSLAGVVDAQRGASADDTSRHQRDFDDAAVGHSQPAAGRCAAGAGAPDARHPCRTSRYARPGDGRPDHIRAHRAGGHGCARTGAYPADPGTRRLGRDQPGQGTVRQSE